MNKRKNEATATHIEDALASTLAAVLACDERDVQVRVEAPRLDGFAGQWHVVLSFDGRDGPEDAVSAARAGADVSTTGDAVGEDGGPEASDATVPVASAVHSDGHEADDVDREGDDRAHGVAEDDGDADASRDEEGGPAADAVDSQEDATSADDVDDAGAAEDRGDDVDALEEEAEAGADFVEGLLDALDLPGDLRIKYAEDHAEVEIIDVGSGALIGRREQTLEAIQELLRCSLQREFQRRARVKVDVEGYRSRRLEKLLEKADEAIDAVLDSGEAERLEPMDVFERKAVHHRVAEVDGLISRSQGREPARRVIIERG